MWIKLKHLRLSIVVRTLAQFVFTPLLSKKDRPLLCKIFVLLFFFCYIQLQDRSYAVHCLDIKTKPNAVCVTG